MLFLVLKHNTDASIQQADQEVTSTEQEIYKHLIEEQSSLSKRVEAKQAEVERKKQRQAEFQASRAELEGQEKNLSDLLTQIQQSRTTNKLLEQEIIALRELQAEAVVETKRVDEEQYLLGMKVEGRRIAILIDQSASMTDELLIDIFTRKFGSEQERKSGPKWIRTVNTAKWILNRLPKNSEFVVVAYSESAKVLGNGSWSSSRDEQTIKGLFSEIENLVPVGGTNLDAGLKAVATLPGIPTNIYLITDGLPTKGPIKSSIFESLGSFRNCSNSSQIVTGECRLKIFHSTTNKNTSAEVNVVLLPLEGDPDAAPAYWAWAARTGGLLLVPSGDWP